jgi:hypothetical protein
MLVHIVVATLPDNSGLDLDRMGTVEDLEPEVARGMLNSGTAREPSEDEIAAYRGENPASSDRDVAVDGPRPYTDDEAPKESEAAEPTDAEPVEVAESVEPEATAGTAPDKPVKARRPAMAEQPAAEDPKPDPRTPGAEPASKSAEPQS